MGIFDKQDKIYTTIWKRTDSIYKDFLVVWAKLTFKDVADGSNDLNHLENLIELIYLKLRIERKHL